MIEFFCPNEHKIRCPKEMAGRPAKCPKCGVNFTIPDMDALSLGVSASSDAVEEAVEAPLATVPPDTIDRPSPPAAAPVRERQIEFLCPNGHHLHGPASLQGRAGECPECNSRFRIPVIDESDVAPEPLPEPELAAEAEALPGDEIALDSAVRSGLAATGGTPELLGFLQVPESSGSTVGAPAADGAPIEILGNPSVVHDGEAAAHPLAALFAELWAARDEGSRVEVHLESGSVVTPDGYLKSHSMGDFAVLLVKDPDGRWTVTIVPWKSIARIILRALKEVPGEIVR